MISNDEPKTIEKHQETDNKFGFRSKTPEIRQILKYIFGKRWPIFSKYRMEPQRTA